MPSAAAATVPPVALMPSSSNSACAPPDSPAPAVEAAQDRAGLEQLAATEAALEVEAAALLRADPQLEPLRPGRDPVPLGEVACLEVGGHEVPLVGAGPVDRLHRHAGTGEDALGLQAGEDADVVFVRCSAEDHGCPLDAGADHGVQASQLRGPASESPRITGSGRAGRSRTAPRHRRSRSPCTWRAASSRLPNTWVRLASPARSAVRLVWPTMASCMPSSAVAARAKSAFRRTCSGPSSTIPGVIVHTVPPSPTSDLALTSACAAPSGLAL